MEVDDNMYISKSRLLFVNIFVSVSIFFVSCSIPQTETQTAFSPILVRRYNAEIDLGKEQILLNNPQLAIEYFKSAIEKNLNFPKAFAGRGTARLALEQYALAIKDLDMALEADWSLHDMQGYNVGKSNIHLLRAVAGIGLLKTIDAKKEVQTWGLTFGHIILDFDMAEFHAGLAEDHELMKKIIKTRHLFDTAKERAC